jgi:hypothetical protein
MIGSPGACRGSVSRRKERGNYGLDLALRTNTREMVLMRCVVSTRLGQGCHSTSGR